MRPFHFIYAGLFGYFWQHCHKCGCGFGGHQWRDDRQVEWDAERKCGTCVYCPKCARGRMGITYLAALATHDTP